MRRAAKSNRRSAGEDAPARQPIPLVEGPRLALDGGRDRRRERESKPLLVFPVDRCRHRLGARAHLDEKRLARDGHPAALPVHVSQAESAGGERRPRPDPDGGRLVVWRLNTGSGQYEMTYLPNGNNANGFHTYSTTPRNVQMNQAGTVIVGMAVTNDG